MLYLKTKQNQQSARKGRKSEERFWHNLSWLFLIKRSECRFWCVSSKSYKSYSKLGPPVIGAVKSVNCCRQPEVFQPSPSLLALLPDFSSNPATRVRCHVEALKVTRWHHGRLPAAIGAALDVFIVEEYWSMPYFVLLGIRLCRKDKTILI